MIWILYVFGTVFSAVFAFCLAVELFFWLGDLGQRLSFLLREALGMCRNKFRDER